MSTENSTTHYVRIPETLNKEQYLTATGIGFYLMMNGNYPEIITPDSTIVKTRVYISAKAQEYLDSLLKSGDFKSKNEVFNKSLSIIAESPQWVRDTII